MVLVFLVMLPLFEVQDILDNVFILANLENIYILMALAIQHATLGLQPLQNIQSWSVIILARELIISVIMTPLAEIWLVHIL